jgi:hypothetical protein
MNIPVMIRLKHQAAHYSTQNTIAVLNTVKLRCKFGLLFERMNGIWVRALPRSMHLGLKTGHLCPKI